LVIEPLGTVPLHTVVFILLTPSLCDVGTDIAV
jgi:hypothetical protein